MTFNDLKDASIPIPGIIPILGICCQLHHQWFGNNFDLEILRKLVKSCEQTLEKTWLRYECVGRSCF